MSRLKSLSEGTFWLYFFALIQFWQIWQKDLFTENLKWIHSSAARHLRSQQKSIHKINISCGSYWQSKFMIISSNGFLTKILVELEPRVSHFEVCYLSNSAIEFVVPTLPQTFTSLIHWQIKLIWQRRLDQRNLECVSLERLFSFVKIEILADKDQS